MRMVLVGSSDNVKTGPIVVSYAPKETCPTSCPLRDGKGCYAATGPCAIQWKRTENSEKSLSWDEFLIRLRKVEPGRLFRWGIAGDLPGIGDRLDIPTFRELVKAARHLRSWCYTHKPLDIPGELEAVKEANAAGWVTNLSADTLQEADRKASLGVAPVVVVIPSDPASWPSQTPQGRRIVVCPATTHGKTCLECRLCYNHKPDRVIVAFPAHGTRKRLVSKLAAS